MTTYEIKVIYQTTISIISNVLGNYPIKIESKAETMNMNAVSLRCFNYIEEIPQIGPEIKFIFTIRFESAYALRTFLFMFHAEKPDQINFDINEVHGIFLCVIFR